jgi:DNA-directed RNA polymerase subunit RPC12/RpoP
MPNIELQKRKFDLFLCFDCKHISAYSENTGEGLKCPVCNSPIVINLGTYAFDGFVKQHTSSTDNPLKKVEQDYANRCN